MPTDEPNREDQAISRLLAERGIARSDRTCLRWRRDGVLLPPDGFDEDDEPVFSSAAVERAVVYAGLLDRLTRPRAIGALWGCGADLPAVKVLGAFRTVYEEEARRLDVAHERLDARSSSTRRQRQLHDELRVRSPEGAKRLDDHVRATMNAAQPDLAFAGIDDTAYVPKLSEARGRIYAELVSNLATGDEDGDATEAVLDVLDASPGFRSSLASQGGIPSTGEKLHVLDLCDRGEIGFDCLVAMRDAMRDALAGHTAETIGAASPVFSSIFAELTTTPERGGLFLAEAAIIGMVRDVRAQEMEETEEGAASA